MTFRTLSGAFLLLAIVMAIHSSSGPWVVAWWALLFLVVAVQVPRDLGIIGSWFTK